MEYKILSSEYMDELAVDVITHLGDGWELAGGVSVAAYTWHDPRNYEGETSTIVYAQAVVRKK